MNHADHDELRRDAGDDGRVGEAIDEDPSKPRRHPRRKMYGIDRLVMGAAYAIQWLRSRVGSHRAGRS